MLIYVYINTYNFYRKFRFIFSLTLSQNAPEAKFQKFQGQRAPYFVSVLLPAALDLILPDQL